jgi:hypothetical protein
MCFREHLNTCVVFRYLYVPNLNGLEFKQTHEIQMICPVFKLSKTIRDGGNIGAILVGTIVIIRILLTFEPLIFLYLILKWPDQLETFKKFCMQTAYQLLHYVCCLLMIDTTMLRDLGCQLLIFETCVYYFIYN